MMNRTLLSLAAGALVLASVSGCVDRGKQEQAKRVAEIAGDTVRAVTTTTVNAETLTDTLTITGEVTAGEDTSVAAKVSGRIAAVYVKDGDQVAAGQLIATLEQTQVQAQLSQAQASVSSAMAALNSAIAQGRQAQAALTQAERNAKTKPQQSTAAVRQAEAQLASAKAQYLKAQNGARPEERRQAEANVASAKSNLDTQQAELARIETLVKEGAVAANRLDQQRTATASARTQYQNAVEALNLIKNGTRSEDIEVARAAVRQAEEAVANAKAGKELDPLLNDQVLAARAQLAASRAQADSARAQVQSAQAQVKIAQESLADTEIRAPFSGKIMGRPAQAGTIASAATTIARIVGGEGLYFTGQLNSNDVIKVKPGMPVQVSVSSDTSKKLPATVAAVSPVGSGIARLFDVRISLPADPIVRAGLFATGTITIRTIADAILVPSNAVVQSGTDHFVFIAEGNKAKKIPVQLGLPAGDKVQVIGLSAGAKVITEGQTSMTDGAAIKEAAPAETTAPAPGASK